MFLLEAIPAIILGFVIPGSMIDRPEKAAGLRDDERERLVNTMISEQAAKTATASHDICKGVDLWTSLADLRVLALGRVAGLLALSALLTIVLSRPAHGSGRAAATTRS